MPAHPSSATRRAFLLAVATAGCGSTLATPHWPTGWVTPRPGAPSVTLTDAQGRAVPLAARLSGSVTVAQLVFTGCGDVCPTQGRLFSQMAARHQDKPVRWLSISIDALGDDAARLLAWQGRLGRHRAWQAAVPAIGDVDALVTYLRGAPAGTAAHTTQVFGFDRSGRLAYRSGDATPMLLLDQLVNALL